MPFILVIVGLIVLVTAIQGTTGALAHDLAQDVFGSGGFLYWFVAILIIGAIGYVKPLKPFSDAFLVLLVLVLVLAHGGVFDKAQQAIAQIAAINTNSQSAPSATQTPTTPQVPSLMIPAPSAEPGLSLQPIPGL